MGAFGHAVFIAHAPLFPYVAHSYIAVDLFFLLSGFVLARTFESRMPRPFKFLSLRSSPLAADRTWHSDRSCLGTATPLFGPFSSSYSRISCMD